MALLDVHRPVSHRHRAAAERQHPGQGNGGGVQTGDLGYDALRAANHPPRLSVVLGPVPGTDKATVLLDAAVGEIGVKVPAPPRDGEQLPVCVSHRVTAGSDDLARGEL